MQLATINGDQPWICTVYFVADEAFNIYWTSTKSRQHSKEIVNHSKVAITVVKDSELKQALQIVGNAYMVEDEDIERIHNLYGVKFGDKPERLLEARSVDPNGRAYWWFKPTNISLWDEVNFPDSPKQEFPVI
jgi:uncharacterized protein YhbP (UPF0306 family)